MENGSGSRDAEEQSGAAHQPKQPTTSVHDSKSEVLEVRGDLHEAEERVLQLSRPLESFHQCLVSFERSVTLAAFVVAGPLI